VRPPMSRILDSVTDPKCTPQYGARFVATSRQISAANDAVMSSSI
jgi:hypothetical protein